jgi:hypothetical protein
VVRPVSLILAKESVDDLLKEIHLSESLYHDVAPLYGGTSYLVATVENQPAHTIEILRQTFHKMAQRLVFGI